MNIETRKKLVAISVFVLPIAMVQLTSMLLSDRGPAQAAAAIPVPVANPAAVVVQLPRVDLACLAAAKHITLLRTKAFGAAPLNYQVEQSQAKVTGQTNPQLAVQMIMVTSQGNVALIGNKEYRVGDQLKQSGWAIEAIDGEKQSVTIVETRTGRTLSASVNAW